MNDTLKRTPSQTEGDARALGLAYAIASEFYIPGSDRDDVLQEARIALWQARAVHDPARSPFLPFAAMVIRRKLSSKIRDARRPNRAILTDAGREVAEGSGEDVADLVALWDRLARVDLSPLERRALAARIRGDEYAHDKSLDNALQRARKKIAA